MESVTNITTTRNERCVRGRRLQGRKSSRGRKIDLGRGTKVAVRNPRVKDEPLGAIFFFTKKDAEVALTMFGFDETNHSRFVQTQKKITIPRMRTKQKRSQRDVLTT